MDQKVSVRLSPRDAEYLAKLQAEKGGSLADVVRDLIEQARQRVQVGEPTGGHLTTAGTVELVHEVSRYTASLLTALVHKVATNPADAEAMIEKAIADAAQASVPKTPEIKED